MAAELGFGFWYALTLVAASASRNSIPTDAAGVYMPSGSDADWMEENGMAATKITAAASALPRVGASCTR